MDLFDRLRQEAIAKRNAAYIRAREEYQQSMAEIKRLKRRLGITVAVDIAPRHIQDLIQAVLPHDRAFTIPDAMEMLRKAAPNRLFFEQSIRCHFQNLLAKGIMRRVRRDGPNVLWAFPEYEEIESRFGAMRTSDVAAVLIQERGPMTDAEIVVVMREEGYRPAASPRTLLNSLQAVLRNNKRFTKGKRARWAVR